MSGSSIARQRLLVQRARSPSPVRSHSQFSHSSPTTAHMTSREFDQHRKPVALSSMTLPRVNPKTGATSQAHMAGKYLLDLASSRNIYPIYDPPFTERNGPRLNDIGKGLVGNVQNYTGKKVRWGPVSYTRPPGVPIEVREEITRNIGQGLDNPLVFFITSNIPHASIVIRTANGRLYSCGYGYYGDVEPGEAPVEAGLQRIVEKIDNAFDLERRLGLNLPHKVEALRGAIYSPDMMDPEKVARIAWVGRLTHRIVGRLNAFLNKTQEIYFGGNYADIDKHGHIPISDKTALTLPDVYMESASMWTRGASVWTSAQIYWNCMEWAKSILDIKLDCGPMSHPVSCTPVTEQEVSDIILATSDEEQKQLIKNVSVRYEIKGVSGACKQVGSTIKSCISCVGSLCSKKKDKEGGRRRRNYKNTRRRIQIRSGTRRSRK